jgi:hypothetical protein
VDVLIRVLREIHTVLEFQRRPRGQRNEAFMALLAAADEAIARRRFGRNGIN